MASTRPFARGAKTEGGGGAPTMVATFDAILTILYSPDPIHIGPLFTLRTGDGGSAINLICV